MLDTKTFQKIIYDWNNIDYSNLRKKSIHGLFSEQVKKTPDNIAIVFNNETLTYKELDKKSSQLAKYILKVVNNNKTLPNDTLIGLYLNRSLEMIIGILAILKAGGAYVPIDPNYPQDRVDYIFRDSNIKTILTQKFYKDILQNLYKTNTISIDSNDYLYENDLDLDQINNPDNLAYIIYTSGTTGKPKGVMQFHHNVTRLFSATNDFFKFDSNDIWTLFHSYVFDFSVWEIWGSLLYGGKLLIPSNELVRSTKDFVEFCYKNKVTVLNQTPLAFYSFIANLDYRHRLNIRYVIFGGDALNISYLKGWWEYQSTKNLDTKLINMYGITETTVHVTYKEITQNEQNISNIGKRISDQKIYILDENLMPVDIGEEGEIYVGGAGLARGYLNKSELTAERFIDNPFKTENDKAVGYTKLYKSGDLGKWLENGDIEYIGRNDFQVKIRGYRIELGEIENTILNHPFVVQTCVLAKNNEQIPYLIAYIKCKDKTIDEQHIIDFLKKVLPDYMIPSYIMFLDNFPLTINGKLDKSALPELEIKRNEYIAPYTSEQKLVCLKFKEVLNLNFDIGIDDDFYSLGGNSIKATSLLSSLRDYFKITIKDIFLLKTPRKLSNLDKQNLVFSIGKTSSRDSYPLSYQQERMFYASRLITEDNILYNVPIRINIKGNINFEKLGIALTKVVKKHSILLNKYSLKDANIFQYINNDNFINISKEIVKVSSQQELDILFDSFIKPFNLENDILVRFKLVKINSEEFCLFADFHHICFDGGSVSIFLNELIEAYDKGSLKAIELQYIDYAVWQKESLVAKNIYKENLEYWKNKLSQIDLDPLEISPDFSKTQTKSHIGNNIIKEFDQPFINKLQNIVDEHQVSISSIMLHAFKVLINKYSQRESFVIGTLTNGRFDSKLDKSIGMFVNTLPFGVKMNANESRIDDIKTIYSQTLDLLDHQDVDLEDLIKQLNLDTSLGNPLCDVVFNFLEHQTEYRSKELIFDIPAWTDPRTAKFDLMLMCHLSTDKLIIEFNFAVDLFKSTTIFKMLSHYENILNELINNLDKKINEYQILSDKEYNQIIYDWNNTNKDFFNQKTVHSLFEDQVVKTPDKIAIIFKDKSLTYKHLNAKANKLAKYLRNKITENDNNKNNLICLCIDRSLEMIINILAILKMGYAYIPIDPKHPKERIKFILDNANPKILICNKHYQNNLNKVKQNNILLLTIEDNYYESNHQSPINLRDIKVNPNDLAYVIYTSGTTGNPKGVMVNHSSIVNRIEYMSRFSNITENDNYFFKTNYIFDVSVSDIFTHICYGASIYISENIFDINEINKNIQLCNSTHLVPSQYEAIANLIKESNIKKLYLSGEAITPQIIKDLAGNIEIYNYYGPTETGEITVSKPTTISNSIGKVFQNNKAYILDKNMKPVPIGVIGELYIAGISLANGYLNRYDLTTEKFVLNPFWNKNKDPELESRLYKTGDLVRWLENGEIEYIGRNDFQIKINGYRIELGEIEKSLTKINEINQSCVITKENNGINYLIAYVTVNINISEEEIKKSLINFIPEYMVPESIIILDKFPLTSNGKLDRKALPNIDLNKKIEIIPPRNPQETMICEAFANIIKNTIIGIDSDFYKIGGNSIKAIQLVYKLQENFKVTIADIFRYKTPRKLAENIIFSKNNLISRLEKIKQQYSSNKNTNNIPFNNTKIKEHDSYSNIKRIYTNKNINTVLLTGATGYLGCNILYQLLMYSDKNIILLIRAKTNLEAKERINKKFNFYFDQNLNNYQNRIKIYSSDIENKNFLGLSEVDYKSLIKNTDSIIHSAALVKHYGEYKDFYSANVQATINLLTLAEKTSLKDFHYISTFGVLLDGYIPGKSHVNFNEQSIGNELIDRNNIYLTTKYEGELECYKYREYGVSTNIYRVGYLSVISFNGKNQENIEENGFFTRFKTMINLGIIAKEVATTEISLVDITAKAIVNIFNKNELSNQTFHVFNPKQQDLSEILTQEKRIHLQQLDIKDFIDVLIDKFSKSTYKNLIEMFMLHQGWLQDSINNKFHPIINNDYTTAIMKNLGISWPKIDYKLIKDIVDKALLERENFYSQINYFDDLAQINELVLSSKLNHYSENDVIAYNSDNLIFVLNGYIEKFVILDGGWEASLSILTANDFFNTEIIVDKKSPAIYKASISDVATLEISKSDIKDILQKHPKMYNNFLRKLTDESIRIQEMYISSII